MRVLNVIMSLDEVKGGGGVERTVQMSRHLVRRGIGTAILSTDLGATPERLSQLAGIDVQLLPCLWERFYLPAPAPAIIRRAVRQADIIHLMNHWTVLNALVYLAARQEGKPYVFCPAGTLPIFGRSGILKRAYNAVIGRRIVRGAARCIAISRDENAHFAAYGAKPERIALIPNGIDMTAARPAEAAPGFPFAAHPFILFIGRLNPIKGPDLLLEAFIAARQEFAGWHLVLAGPDEGMAAALRARARSAGMSDCVHLPGYLGSSAKYGLARSCRFLAIPSRQEAMSIVVLEAGANSRPVLMTDRCGLEDVAASGGGIMTSPDVASMTAGLRRMRGSDLDAMGAALHRLVRERYSWDTIMDRLLDLYRGVLQS